MGSAKGSGIGARVLLVAGFLAAFGAYTTWYGSRLAFDPGATRDAAHAILQAPAVQHALATNISEAVDKELTGANVDPQVRAAVDRALHDPRFTVAFADAVAQVQRALLSEHPGTITIDPQSLTGAVHDQLARTNPKLASQLARHDPIRFELGGDNLPSLRGARDTAHGLTALLAFAALALIGASLYLDHSRRAVSRCGRRLAYLAIGPALVFAVAPRILDGQHGDVPQVAAAVLHTYAPHVLPSAIGLAVAGVIIVLGALGWPRRRSTDEAAPAAAEPVAATPLPSPLQPAAGERAPHDPLYL